MADVKILVAMHKVKASNSGALLNVQAIPCSGYYLVNEKGKHLASLKFCATNRDALALPLKQTGSLFHRLWGGEKIYWLDIYFGNDLNPKLNLAQYFSSYKYVELTIDIAYICKCYSWVRLFDTNSCKAPICNQNAPAIPNMTPVRIALEGGGRNCLVCGNLVKANFFK